MKKLRAKTYLRVRTYSYLTFSVPTGPERSSEYNLVPLSLTARATHKIVTGHLSYPFRIYGNEKIGSHFEKTENINIQLWCWCWSEQ